MHRMRHSAQYVPPSLHLGEDNGKTRIVDKYSEKTSEDVSVGNVPRELYDDVKKVAEACPVQAITIEEIPET